MAVRATHDGYTLRIDANASGYAFSGLQKLPTENVAKIVVWVSGSMYQVLNTSTGIIEHSGNNAYDAIKYAQSGAFTTLTKFLDLPDSNNATLQIKDGHYIFGSGFAGFDIHEKVDWRMGRNAVFLIPPMYSGYAFRLSNYLRGVTINGGILIESGSAADLEASGRKWTGYYFDVSGVAGTAADGISFVDIEKTYVRNPNIAFDLNTHYGGYLTVNTIQDSLVHNPVRGIRYTSDSSGFSAGGIFRTLVQNVIVQTASGITRAGLDADGLAGRANEFHNVTFYDMGGSGTYSAHIGKSGCFTIIVGNAFTHNDFYHSGEGAKIIDQEKGAYFGSTVEVSGVILNRAVDVSGQAAIYRIQNSASGAGAQGAIAVRLVPFSGNRNANLSIYDGSETERLLIQKTSTGNNLIGQATLSGGVVLPVTVQMLDSNANTTIEGMRVDTSGNVEFNRSGGTVQFKSGNTSTTASGTNANSGFFNPRGFITARLGTSAIKIPFFD